MASETGVLPVKPEEVRMKGGCSPAACCWLIPSRSGLFRTKKSSASWLAGTLCAVDQGKPDHAGSSSRAAACPRHRLIKRSHRQRAFGYTDEDLTRYDADGGRRRGSDRLDGYRYSAGVPVRQAATAIQLLQAVVRAGHESGDRSDSRRFGDVATTYIGCEGNILDETPKNCHTLKLKHPIVTNGTWSRCVVFPGRLSCLHASGAFQVDEGVDGLERALKGLCRRASWER